MAKDKVKVKPDPNKKRLITGLVLIICAFICILGLFKFMVDFQKVNVDKIDALEVNLQNLKIEREKTSEELESLKKAPPKPINLEDIVRESQKVYGVEEKNQKQGYLWIDRQTSTYLVTLGALNGLHPGSRLGIYSGNDKIGQAVVETPLDVISYVRPMGKKLDEFESDYYRVEIE